jgi:hypothetical protein
LQAWLEEIITLTGDKVSDFVTGAAMVAKYDNKAVIHTHYGANNAQPNYGHTKPYDKKYETGYGYTVVIFPNSWGWMTPKKRTMSYR